MIEQTLQSLGPALPARLSHKLSPEDNPDAEEGDEGCSDLLSANQRRSTAKDGRRDVVLSIETFSALQSKVVNISSGVAMFIGYGVLVAVVICKFLLDERAVYNNDYLWASIAVAGACLLALLVRGSIFAARIVTNVKQGNHWPHRRLKRMSLAFVALIVQIINLLAWLAPNAYLVSVPCRWNGFNHIVIISFITIRWTCWNTHLCIFLIQAHGLCAWTSPKARLHTRQSAPLIMDAPWSVHAWKFCAWLAFETVLLTWVGVTYTGSPGGITTAVPGCVPPFASYSELPTPTDKSCGIGTRNWGKLAIAGMTIAYFLVFLAYIGLGFIQLHARPFRDRRTAIILFRLQMRTTFIVNKVIFVCQILLWFVEPQRCWSTVFSWYGMAPMQIVLTVLMWENCWYFMPSAANEEPILQVHLQEFAWSEEAKPAAVARRADHALHAAEHALLTAEPMFCFQTAVALHRWSCLTYMNLESVRLPGVKKAAQEASEDARQEDAACGRDAALDCPEESLLEAAVAFPSAKPERPKLQACASFVGFTSDGLVESDCPTHDRTDSGLTATTSYAGSETGSTLTEDVPAGSGRERRRAGRRRHAARRSPEAVREALEAGMSMYSLTSCKLFWDAVLDTKALLAWSQDTAVLAFRGTASLTNACSDLKVWMCPHPPKRGSQLLGTCPMVHTGFHKAWTASGLHTEVISYLQDLVGSGQLSRHARLLVTGHSLGGALAVLAAMDIQLAMSDFCMEMYTYGTPYPGNRAFANEVNALLPNTWHVIHDGDAVTRTGKFFVGKRPGQRVIVDQFGEMRVRPNILELQLQGRSKVNPHYLESYRTALQAAMLLPFGRRGTPRDRAGVLSLGQQPVLRAILAAEGPNMSLRFEGEHWSGKELIIRAVVKVEVELVAVQLTDLLPSLSRALERRVDWEVMQEVHTSGRPLQPGKGGRPLRSFRTEPVSRGNSYTSTPKARQ